MSRDITSVNVHDSNPQRSWRRSRHGVAGALYGVNRLRGWMVAVGGMAAARQTER